MFLAELDEAGNQAKTYTLGNEYAGHVSELNNSLTSENKAASYYITDEQGSIRYILDQSGEVLNFYQYSAFGETIISEETTPNRLRYNAQTEDELTGLYYLRARYYAPNIGRFTQEDVIYNDGLNLYAYCNSNPVMYSDPSGFAKETCKSKVGGECGSETSYGKSTFNSLKNTENFTDSAIEHIFEGQVNARGKAVGYHYEGIEGTSSGGIEMKYRIEEYKLKNGIEDISIIFDEKYQLLTTFMSCDVLPFEKWIKSGFDRVLSGKSEYEEVNGNVCCAEISPKTTKVYDNLAEDAMGNWCEVDTKELRQLIDEWCDKVQKFKMSITTKPPHRQA